MQAEQLLISYLKDTEDLPKKTSRSKKGKGKRSAFDEDSDISGLDEWGHRGLKYWKNLRGVRLARGGGPLVVASFKIWTNPPT